MTSHISRRAVSMSFGVSAAVAAIAVGASSVGATTAGRPDSGTLYMVSIGNSAPGKVGGWNGAFVDKALGSGAVLFHFSGTQTPTTFKAVATLYTGTGSLSGPMTARLSSASPPVFSNGKMKLTSGTGTLKGHSLVGTFTQSKTSPITASFKVTGTYK